LGGSTPLGYCSTEIQLQPAELHHSWGATRVSFSLHKIAATTTAEPDRIGLSSPCLCHVWPNAVQRTSTNWPYCMSHGMILAILMNTNMWCSLHSLRVSDFHLVVIIAQLCTRGRGAATSDAARCKHLTEAMAMHHWLVIHWGTGSAPLAIEEQACHACTSWSRL